MAETEVFGVVEVHLDRDPCWQDGEFIGRPAGIPVGVRVRVQIGDRRFVGMDDTARVASVTYGAASVEVVGTHAPAVADLLAFLRDRQRQWQGIA